MIFGKGHGKSADVYCNVNTGSAQLLNGDKLIFGVPCRISLCKPCAKVSHYLSDSLTLGAGGLKTPQYHRSGIGVMAVFVKIGFDSISAALAPRRYAVRVGTKRWSN